MAQPSKSRNTTGTSKVPRTNSTSSRVDAATSYKTKAARLRAAKLDNAQAQPVTAGEYIPWAKLANRERPILRETGGTGAPA